MKPVRISFKGVVDAVFMVIAIIVSIIMVLITVAIVWAMLAQHANSSWWWKVPTGIGGVIAFLIAGWGFLWLYDKDPAINIGGPKKVSLPKAEVFTGKK